MGISRILSNRYKVWTCTSDKYICKDSNCKLGNKHKEAGRNVDTGCPHPGYLQGKRPASLSGDSLPQRHQHVDPGAAALEHERSPDEMSNDLGTV